VVQKLFLVHACESGRADKQSRQSHNSVLYNVLNKQSNLVQFSFHYKRFNLPSVEN
jgi:hypothetical protein